MPKASASQQNKQKLWSGFFVAFLALLFLCFVVGQGLNSGTTVYLSRVGFGTPVAGALALTFSGSGAVSRLLVEHPIDAGKASLVAILGCTVLLIGTFLPAICHGLPFLVCARCLQGLGFASATTAASTAVADIVPSTRLGEGIGYGGLGQALAMSIGPAFALYLAGTDPALNLYLGLALVAAAALAVAFACRYEHKVEKLPESCSFRMRAEGRIAQKAEREHGFAAVFEKRALPGTIPMLVNSSAFGFGIFYVGLYGTQIGMAQAGLFFTLSAVSMVGIRLLSRTFMDTVVPIKIYTGAIACGFLCFGLLYFAPVAHWAYYVAGIFYGLCLGVSLPINQTVAVKNTPSTRWGATNALFLLANDIGIGCSSLIWGYLNNAFGFQFSILCVLGCLALAYLLAWICYPAEAKRWKS